MRVNRRERRYSIFSEWGCRAEAGLFPALGIRDRRGGRERREKADTHERLFQSIACHVSDDEANWEN